ncbi:MAG: hypothetical protein WC852_04785 [Candidatus Nanoarchaeia archaeon]|jgi:hypothetical protein
MSSHAATADEMGMGGYSGAESGKPKPKYGWTDVRRYIPTEEGKAKTKSKAAFWIVLFLLILLAVYGYYWAASPGGQRSMFQLKNAIAPYNPVTWYSTEIAKAQDIGNIWTSEPTAVEKKGILFESFKPVGSEEIPQGTLALFTYGLRLSNAEVSRTPVTLTCDIKGKDLKGDILPTNPIYITGKRITENARCRLSKELTSALSGTVEVEGGASFPFKTEDVKLKVYLTSRAMEDSLPDDEDFFSYMNIQETQPIRAQYNGEPVEIGIGVSTENTQPVVIEEGINPLVGITINNRWDGKMTNLTSLTLTLPKELTINEEVSSYPPNEVCPFTLSRQGYITNEYKASGEIIESISLESGRLRSFECWLNIAPELLGSAPYVVKEYAVDAEYNYQLPTQTATITVKKIASADGGSGMGEAVTALV